MHERIKRKYEVKGMVFNFAQRVTIILHESGMMRVSKFLLASVNALKRDIDTNVVATKRK
ncbi:hypothetical protein AWC11_27370 [Mycobacterium interjectum]|nr:hypothetical protein AWC11_27370 [Mycobacterium interjectum]